jgi:hypothetical protein
MKIYIASSWKNQHAVEMLTALLERAGHEVLSFVRNNHGEQAGHLALSDDGKPMNFDEWVWSDRGLKSFEYDTGSATKTDLVIYIGPSGTDAWAEVGAAWASGVPIFGLHAKGEQAWLMRRMVDWFDDYVSLIDAIEPGAATEYRHLLDDFINECCIIEPGAKDRALSLYRRFTSWYEDNVGSRVPTAAWFGKSLSAKYKKSKQEGCIMYHGITLKSMPEVKGYFEQ